MTISDRERKIRQRLKSDFVHYADKALRIRSKSGAIVPLVFNASQKRLIAMLEKQKKQTGRVRALVPKARQLGVSTVVGARFFHQVTHHKGQRAFILTHRDQATLALFEMAKRFHDNCPPQIRPNATTRNANELSYGGIDSGYKVATAKAEGVGRAETIQLFHGSEVAFWHKAGQHAAGALQAVPDQPNTEIILESTGNGVGGYFYTMCMAAQKGDSEYQVCFLPWHKHPEYTTYGPDAKAASAHKFSRDWLDYQQAHQLPATRLLWAYRKNLEFASAANEDPDKPSWLFRQEYPATLEEVFQLSQGNTFIPAYAVLTARNRSLNDPKAPLVIGVDVALGGGDYTYFISRRGRVAGREVFEKLDTDDSMVITQRILELIEEHRPKRIFIDLGGGYGSGPYDRLRELGYGHMVTGVKFGNRASNSRDYANKRAEIWGLMRDWLTDPGGADIIDNDELMTHLVAPGARLNTNDQTILESKDEIRVRLQLSPDAGDALALTFAQKVYSNEADRLFKRRGDDKPPMQPDWEPEMVT